MGCCRAFLVLASSWGICGSSSAAGGDSCKIEGRFFNKGISYFVGDTHSSASHLSGLARAEELFNGGLFKRDGSAYVDVADAADIKLENDHLSLTFYDRAGTLLATVNGRGQWKCTDRGLTYEYDRDAGAEGSPGKAHMVETLVVGADGSLILTEVNVQTEGSTWGGPRDWTIVAMYRAVR